MYPPPSPARVHRFPAAARKLTIAVAAAATAAAVAAMAPAANAAITPSPFTCRYTFTAWPGGFSADLKVANSGPAVDGWTVHWTFDSATQAATVWSAQLTQANPYDAVAKPMPWNTTIPANSSITFGWTAFAATTSTPTDITVNGKRC